MADKVKTKVFHGGKFKLHTTKNFSNEAESVKAKLQRDGKKVRVTTNGGKHRVWVRGK